MQFMIYHGGSFHIDFQSDKFCPILPFLAVSTGDTITRTGGFLLSWISECSDVNAGTLGDPEEHMFLVLCPKRAGPAGQNFKDLSKSSRICDVRLLEQCHKSSHAH